MCTFCLLHAGESNVSFTQPVAWNYFRQCLQLSLSCVEQLVRQCFTDILTAVRFVSRLLPFSFCDFDLSWPPFSVPLFRPSVTLVGVDGDETRRLATKSTQFSGWAYFSSISGWIACSKERFCFITNTGSSFNFIFLLLAAPFHKLLEAHLGFAFRMGSDVRDCFIDST